MPRAARSRASRSGRSSTTSTCPQPVADERVGPVRAARARARERHVRRRRRSTSTLRDGDERVEAIRSRQRPGRRVPRGRPRPAASRSKLYDYVEHALSAGGDAQAAAYVELQVDGERAVGRRHRRRHLDGVAQGHRLGREPRDPHPRARAAARRRLGRRRRRAPALRRSRMRGARLSSAATRKHRAPRKVPSVRPEQADEVAVAGITNAPTAESPKNTEPSMFSQVHRQVRARGSQSPSRSVVATTAKALATRKQIEPERIRTPAAPTRHPAFDRP